MDGRWIAPIALIALAGCHRNRPEDQIQRAFDTCVKAIEAADPGSALDVLGPHFAGPGGMTREEAKRVLEGLLRQGRIGITVSASLIAAKEDQGDQAVEVILTRRSDTKVMPTEATRVIFRLHWERLNGIWRLQSLLPPSGNA
jgi:hypothetical protein